MPKTTSIETAQHLRQAMTLWQSSPVETTEGGALILAPAMGLQLEALFDAFRADLEEESRIAQRRSEQMRLRGTSEGRSKIKLPDVAILKARLVRTTMADLAKELGVTRQTLRNHVKGGYVANGEFVSYEGRGIREEEG